MNLDGIRNFELLYNVDLLWITLALLLTQIAAGVLGYWLGQQRKDRVSDEAKSYIGTLQGVLFSLLTLTMSFTLSFALNRYEARRSVLLQEANAIGTTFLRALTLPEPYREVSKSKLRAYVDNRDALYEAVPGTPAFDAVLTETDRQQVALWRDVERLMLDHPNERYTQLYQLGLNDLIDAHANRVAALRFHIPEVVLWLLMLLAVAANFGMGYSRGLAGSRQIASQLFITVIMVVMNMVIMDADRPRRGLIQVTNAPMRSVESLMDTFYGNGYSGPRPLPPANNAEQAP